MVKVDTRKPASKPRPKATPTRRPRPRRRTFWLRRALVGCAALAVVVLVAFAIDQVVHAGAIGRGVHVGGVDVSGMDRADAEAAVGARAHDLLGARITVKANDETLDILPSEVDARIDVAATVDAAFAAGGTWNPLTWAARWFAPADVDFEGVTISTDAVRERIGPEFVGVEDAPADAEFVVDGKTVTVKPARAGHGLDVDEAATDLAAAVVASGDGRHVEIPISEVQPRLTTEAAEAMGIRDQLATFTTKFPSGEARVKNIARIGEIVDGKTIAPGERFSVNEFVGPRTEDKGFVRAPVIYDGEFSDDIGGGVSQFGTTMFNAAFFAGVPIEEFKAHSFYISRYPLGREATLSYPHPDVVFVNDYASTMLIKVSVLKDRITVSLYGTLDGRKVETETGPKSDPKAPKTECKRDAALKAGTERTVQKPDWGYAVQFTRTVTRADGSSDEKSWTTTYAPKNQVITYNPPAAADAAPTTTSAPTSTAPPHDPGPISTNLTCPGVDGRQPDVGPPPASTPSSSSTTS
ncbi:MAG: VanW family protein [Acidimicrobiia bacterium]|nr:VanW family protein [Acidimicrobiia bacterium]